MKKIMYSSILFALFIWFFILPSNVKAYNLGSGVPLTYGNSTYAYNYTSATDWSGGISLYKSNGYDGGVYYTSSVTTGTYGIGFGQFLNGILLPKHYYRITWVAYNTGGANCAGPNSWASQLRTGTGNGNSVQVSRTYFNYIGLQNNINIFIDDPEATYSITGCAYTIVTAFSNAVSWLNFPVNSSTTVNSQWNYYGYYIEDLGSTDTVTNSELQNSINNIQNSIISNANTNTQNIINNQNQNAQQAHQDAQNTQNTIKDDNVNSNTGKSFFDNFSDNTHGLSGIVTAPLNMINGLVNVSSTSCIDLTGTYQNQNFSIPCGKMLWGHTGISQFNDFYNLVVGGALCYWIIRDLFLTIESLKDPDNDKVEVMSL